MRFSIASWNIGGGIPGESHQFGGQSRLEYYADIIRATRPDILCLQEAHEYANGDTQAKQMAELADYPNFVTIPLSSSHLAADAWLSLAVLSKFPIRECAVRKFPRMEYTSIGPNGHEWTLHDKGYLILEIEVAPATSLNVINGHCFPLHHFTSEPPNSSRFARIWEMLRADLERLLSEDYAIVAIDLNYPRPEAVLGDLIGARSFVPTFTGTPTKPSGVQHDFILKGPNLTTQRYQVIDTMADHHYCYAEFGLL